MTDYSLYGKRRLCSTDFLDYTDYQGVGHDPLFKRFESVISVVRAHIPTSYQHFLSQPLYSSNDDIIYWYVEDWKQEPLPLTQLEGEARSRYEQIKEETLNVYKACLEQLEGEERFILSGALKYIDNEMIYCCDEKVVLVAWGMKPCKNKHHITGAVVYNFTYGKKHTLTFDEGNHGKLTNPLFLTLRRTEGSILSVHDLPEVIANEGYKFVEWEPQVLGYVVTEDKTFVARYELVIEPKQNEPSPAIQEPIVEKPIHKEPEIVTAQFRSDANGKLIGETIITLLKGESLAPEDIPTVCPEEGKKFVGWSPALPAALYQDSIFYAQYQEELYPCVFVPGEFGDLEGEAEREKKWGTHLDEAEVPEVVAHKGYKFTQWEPNPMETLIQGRTEFTAHYEKDIPWYKRLWNWLKSEPVRKWLKRILLFLLFIILMLLLFQTCQSCERQQRNTPSEVHQRTMPDGRVIDDNRPQQPHRPAEGGRPLPPSRPGEAAPITNPEGQLPSNPSLIVAPVVGEDGSIPPIDKGPGKPETIANRLNLYFEDDEADLQAFANAFKQAYPSDDYQIIGCDEKVKLIQIQLPENQRNTLRDKLPAQFPDFSFFVVDETLFKGGNWQKHQQASDGWHLKAVHAKQAWQITQGKEEVVIAVVDDGIDFEHPMFTGRITKPYNVFTQTAQLSKGEGHGTHVAGLAAGSDDYLSQGAAGLAPKCRLMPIQVFDNGYCTFSSVTSGIMYAIHEGAQVVNVSLGPNLQGISELPLDQQRDLARSLFKNEEKVWRKILAIANQRNCVLVFAVGNDRILASIPAENRIGTSINVAAVDQQYQSTRFTNFGPGANISAPGEQIVSAFPNASLKCQDGTSMAAPIVSGIVALMKSLKADLSVQQLLNILQHTGRTIDQRVPPMVLADKALQAIQGKESEVDQSPTPDYEKIRAQIREYQRRIKELQQLLPEYQK